MEAWQFQVLAVKRKALPQQDMKQPSFTASSSVSDRVAQPFSVTSGAAPAARRQTTPHPTGCQDATLWRVVLVDPAEQFVEAPWDHVPTHLRPRPPERVSKDWTLKLCRDATADRRCSSRPSAQLMTWSQFNALQDPFHMSWIGDGLETLS